MTRLSGLLGFMGALMVAASGCERTPAPPTASKTQAKTPATLPSLERPTTQELLSGPYKKINLPGMPLALMVPQSWNVESLNSLIFLGGPTPSDSAKIQLTPRAPIQAERFDLFFERMSKDSELGPASTSAGPRKIEASQIGRMRVLQRIWTLPSTVIPKTGPRGIDEVDAQGRPVMTTITPVNWLVNAFIPQDNMVASYELGFLGLTAEQYDADKELLEKIVNSLRVEDNAAVPTLPTDSPLQPMPLPPIR